jgi:hypothetical protein
MTTLASQLVEEGLSRSRGKNIVTEEPAALDPRDRTEQQDH